MLQKRQILQRIVDELDRAYKKRKFKTYVGKSSVMVFKKAKEQTIHFEKPFTELGKRAQESERSGDKRWGKQWNSRI